MIARQLASSGTRFTNRILQNLPEDSIRRLNLSPIDLPVDYPIETPGCRITHMYFLETGAASMTTVFKDGREAEVNLFGFESVIGASAVMGTRRSLNRIYMQIAGQGFVAPLEGARREFRSCGRFHDLTLAYVQAQLVVTAQSAGCNVMHHLEQRLSRWLLLCADRSRTDSFRLSQEFLAMMLGVQRSSVNFAMNQLAAKGLIRISRNQVKILSTKELERQACECYQIVKDHLENSTEFDAGQDF